MEVRLNLLTIDKEEFTIEDAKEAAEKIFACQVDDFYALKNEKWYKHFLNALTFGTDRKTKVLNDIRSLSALQVLFVKVFYEYYKDTDEKLNELINSLKKTNQTVKQLYLSCVIGVKPQVKIDSLKNFEQALLLQTITQYKSVNDKESDLQHYRASISRSLGIGLAEGEFDSEQLDKISGTAAKVIYRCLVEMRVLDGLSEFPDSIKEILNSLSISPNARHAVECDVSNEVDSFGVEYLLVKYVGEEIDAFESSLADMVWAEEECLNDEITTEYDDDDDDDLCEMTDELINTMLNIGKDVKKKFRYKRIHLNAFIECEGSLCFDHCIIYYNESEAHDEITLKEAASLTISNSTIICCGIDTEYFISCEGKNEVRFTNSTFGDCSYFLFSDRGCNLQIQNCMIHNAYHGFIDIYRYGDDQIDISGNKIILDDLQDFYSIDKKHCFPPFFGTFYTRIPTIILITGHGGLVNFNNNTTEADPCYYNILDDRSMTKSCVLTCHGIDIRNCTFNGLPIAISASGFYECKFENCKNTILCEDTGETVDNCVFINCSNIILDAKTGMRIENCQFVSCYDSLIRSKDDRGGIIIQFCHFVDTTAHVLYGEDYCISLRRGSNSGAKANQIKKCIFEGVTMKEGFLIGANGDEKPKGPVISIENCDFKYCVTRRQSKKIIKEYLEYYTFLKKDKSFHANVITDCRGLDKINEGGKVFTNPEVRTTSTSGNPIGASLR